MDFIARIMREFIAPGEQILRRSAASNPQRFQDLEEIIRQRRGKAQRFLRSRMNEGKFARVQHYPRRLATGQFCELLVLPGTVGFVAHERMTEELEMHANLVRPARV